MDREIRVAVDTNRVAELEMRVKALEADSETLRRRTVELSRVLAEQSATLLEVANLGEATSVAVAHLSRRVRGGH